uniref:Plant heme peroxidase family profile domain-containing protein n=1 Tax=Entomoneis paludosa TaxID=265537 RepID=A0A6U3E418_9STRA
MPQAGLDSDGLRLYFGTRLGLSEPEWVALCGIHGLGRHVSLLGMDKACLRQLTRTCLEEAPILLPFVTSSVGRFNNDYFKALLRWNARQVEMGEVAFIPTDVALVVDSGLRVHVEAFAKQPKLYERTFVRAFQKLLEGTATATRGSDLSALTARRY